MKFKFTYVSKQHILNKVISNIERKLVYSLFIHWTNICAASPLYQALQRMWLPREGDSPFPQTLCLLKTISTKFEMIFIMVPLWSKLFKKSMF